MTTEYTTYACPICCEQHSIKNGCGEFEKRVRKIVADVVRQNAEAWCQFCGEGCASGHDCAAVRELVRSEIEEIGANQGVAELESLLSTLAKLLDAMKDASK